MSDEIRNSLLIAALQNAIKHKSVPSAGAVMGFVLGHSPELRPQAGVIKGILPEVMAEVEAMSHEEREIKLEAIAPDVYNSLFEKKEKKVHVLPDLPNAEKGVVMRFAPNPSGPLHLGHARAAFLNDEYIRRYGGKYILRIEDTDPKRVDPEAYRMVPEDIEWMGLKITDTVYQSDRFPLYYDVGCQLIEKGAAYVCRCNNDEFKVLKDHKMACPCRSQTPEEAMDLFERMLAGEFEEGTISVRLKTDLNHPDPAMRDFPLFRVLTSTKHLRKPDTIVYPLMNLSVTVDDHLLGMTHVIRGKDHIANTRRQEFIFKYMGWETPVYRHYGRMGIDGVVLSTSAMRAGINSGEYTGWDDVHLGTLRAMARRGIEPEAVRNTITDIGIGETDISFSWENLYAKNKELIDHKADRFFFVADPVKLNIEGAEDHLAKAMRYPGDESRGYREIPFKGSVVVPSNELSGHDMIRLKDLFNINLSGMNASFAGYDLQQARDAKAPIIQWLPDGFGVKCTIRKADGDLVGVVEPEVKTWLGKTIQFERVGFVKVDSVGDEIIAYFAHR